MSGWLFHLAVMGALFALVGITVSTVIEIVLVWSDVEKEAEEKRGGADGG